jgi:ribonuclease D
MLITTSDALADFCAALRGSPYIAVDTEFLREKTYRAQLCLVQVAYGEHAAAIDPLAPDLDLGPLRDLLHDRATVKVLHAATQDLEIFLDKTGSVPGPIFDTQIAASVCGLGEQPGYAALVEKMAGVRIDKASQATDWSVRPLSPRQLDYALSDVTHLCVVYERLVARLDETGRTPWIAEDMTALEDPTRYRVDPRDAWRRVRIRRAKPKTLAVLRELAAWREETAVHRDLPRKWVMKDEVLVEVAQNLPDGPDALTRVRGLPARVAKGPDGAAMLAAMAVGAACPEADWPEAAPRRKRLEGHEPLVALLQALLQLRCDAHDVAPAVVARRADLDRIATEEAPDVAALEGWRRQIFGADALALRAGELALTAAQGVVVTVPTGGAPSR